MAGQLKDHIRLFIYCCLSRKANRSFISDCSFIVTFPVRPTKGLYRTAQLLLLFMTGQSKAISDCPFVTLSGKPIRLLIFCYFSWQENRRTLYNSKFLITCLGRPTEGPSHTACLLLHFLAGHPKAFIGLLIYCYLSC